MVRAMQKIFVSVDSFAFTTPTEKFCDASACRQSICGERASRARRPGVGGNELKGWDKERNS